MARIRTIKPEFWDDEKLSKVSRDARLTFIGLWTHSDDYGVVRGNSVWLRSKIYPYDDIPTEAFRAWIDELIAIGLIVPFDANGEAYYLIKNFNKHQIVDRPSKNRNPSPPGTILGPKDEPSAAFVNGLDDDSSTHRRSFDDDSTNNRITIDEGSMTRRRSFAVGKGKGIGTRKGNGSGKGIEGGMGGERENQPAPDAACQTVPQEPQPASHTPLHPPHAPKETKADKRKTKLPQDFTLAETLITYAKQHGIHGDSVREVFDHFCDYHRANGSLMLDWAAAWRTWIRNEARFRARYQKREPEQLSYIELRKRMGAPEYADDK